MKPWTTALLPALVATLLTAGCGAPPGVEPGDVIHSRISLVWNLERLSDKDPFNEAGPVECSSIGADLVYLRAVGEVTGDIVVERFDCTDGAGSTEVPIADIYDAEILLLNCKSSPTCNDPIVLAEGKPITIDVLLADHTIHLGTVRFFIQ